jgi:hypothetical protein
MVLFDENGRSMLALTVFSESIRYFKKHFLCNTRNAGLNFREDEVHWVLTIPAIWDRVVYCFCFCVFFSIYPSISLAAS